MGRSGWRGLTLLLVVAGGLVALHQGREVVAERVARHVLEARGLSGGEFRVTALGWREAVVEDVSLHEAGVTGKRIVLRYEPAALVAGRLGEIRLEGFRLDGSGGLGAASSSLPAQGGDGGGGLEVETVTIADTRILLAEPFAGEVAVEGRIRPSGGGEAAELRLDLGLGPLTGALRIVSDGLTEGARVEAEGDLSLDLAGLGRIAGRESLALEEGRAALTFAGHLTAPRAWDVIGAAVEDLALSGDLRIEGARDAAGREVSGDVAWRLEGRDGRLALALPRAARFEAAGLGADAPALFAPQDDAEPERLVIEIEEADRLAAWRRVGDGGSLEAAGEIRIAQGGASAALELAAEVEHDANGRLAGPAPVSAAVSLSGLRLARDEGSAEIRDLSWRARGTLAPGGAWQLAGPVEATAGAGRLGGVAAERASLKGELRVAGQDAAWSVVAAPGLTLTLDALAAPGVAEATGAVGLTLREGRISGGGSGVSAAFDATAGAFDARLATGRGGMAIEDVEGRVVAEFDAAMRGQARLTEGAARLPELSLAVSDLTGTLASRGVAAPADLSLWSRLRDTDPARRFPPLEATLAGTLDGGAVALSGTAAGAGGVSLPVEVTADLRAGAAEARFGPGRARFRPGGLQPAAFGPRFAALRDADGSVEIDGSLSKPAGGAASTRLRLRFIDLSASAGDAGAEGLSGELAFSSLSPLVSAGVQRLSARRLIAGVPLTDADLRFSVAPGRGGPSIRIRQATAGLAGGSVVLSDATWNTGAAINAAEVAVRDVSVERLLRDWRIEGVGGTGRLSGTIPIRVGRDGVSVEGGRLEADGPGVVRVDWGGARRTLVGAGEQVELAVRALEDFRYEALSMGVDQAPGEALTLSVRLEGANPDVLDGHPFRFNVNLSGRLEPILEAVREGRRIGADLIRGGLGGAR